VLSRLPEAKRARLLDDDSLVRLHAGRWLFRTGDPADAMYVVRSGRLEVVADGVLRELGEGDVVGELALLTGSPRSAGVRARRDSVLWRVTPERFDTVVQRDPAALRALAVSLAEQVQSPRSTDGRPTAPRVVSVVGIGDGAPVAAVADRLAAELSRHLRVHVTTSMTAEDLHRAEPQNDRVLLVAEAPRRRFHGFAGRQADRIVDVADAASLPPTCLANAGPEGHVLLVGAAPARSTVVAWHDALTPRTVTPTDEAGLPAGVSAIARRIGGRSLGVVVAGGGARSLAAIGVLEELERAGYVVDRYAGCSVGSVVAGLASLGRDAASIDAICYDEFVRRNPFNDYRFPTVSIAAGHKTESAIQRQFGEMLFEELPSELVLVSTNLLDRSLVVHRRGAVGAAVRASLSLPGLYPPARVDDGVHVDGGVLDNLPVQPLADRDEGPVVAIDISAGSSSRTRSGPPPTPSLGETLLRTMLIGGSLNLEEARRRAAIVVTPDTRGIGLLEFHQLDRAREAGRAAGLAVVAALPEVLVGRAPDVPAQRSPGALVIDLRDPVTTRAPRGPR
jgi:predicted acylesterase/phospholipase RssA